MDTHPQTLYDEACALIRRTVALSDTFGELYMLDPDTPVPEAWSEPAILERLARIALYLRRRADEYREQVHTHPLYHAVSRSSRRKQRRLRAQAAKYRRRAEATDPHRIHHYHEMLRWAKLRKAYEEKASRGLPVCDETIQSIEANEMEYVGNWRYFRERGDACRAIVAHIGRQRSAITWDRNRYLATAKFAVEPPSPPHPELALPFETGDPPWQVCSSELTKLRRDADAVYRWAMRGLHELNLNTKETSDEV